MTPHELALELGRELARPQTLEPLLERLVERAAAVCQTRHAAVRLLDLQRGRLLVSCRKGSALHHDASFEFKIGEGLLGWVAQTGLVLRTGNAPEDHRFLPRTDAIEPFSSFLGVPLIAEGATTGVLSLAHPLVDHFTDEHEAWAQLMAALAAPHLEMARRARLLRVDSGTGLLGDPGLGELVPPAQVAEVLSLLVVDVDGFRARLEAAGPPVGEHILRTVAQVLAAHLQLGEAVVRSGGDELLLTLPGTSLLAASRAAERVRRQIHDASIELGQGPLRVTVSIGVAERRASEPTAAALARARQALESARARGGDCVQLALDGAEA